MRLNNYTYLTQLTTRSQLVSSKLGISMVLAWRLFLLVFYQRAGSYPMFQCFRHGFALLYQACCRAISSAPRSAVYCCNLCLRIYLCLQFYSAQCLGLLAHRAQFQCVFFPFLLTPYYYYQQQYYSRHFSTELLVQCDGCLGWGWVWWAGLVVGQALGFFLPGLGVGGSSPQVPRHPTSM